MGLFGNKKTEEPTPKKKVEVVEEEEMDELISCDDCGEDFKESMLDDDGLCKVCAKKKEEATTLKKDMCYTFTVLFEADDDGDTEDDLAINGLCEADAKALYNNVKTALKNKEDYFELPDMQQYDFDNERIKKFYPEYVRIVNVRKAYYEKDNNEDE